MLNIGNGKRDGWVFEYTAAKLAEGAQAQKLYRQSRADWWAEQKAAVMKEVRESGIEISESVAAGLANYTNSQSRGPQVGVRADLQAKLSECHGKIQQHQQAVAEYDGWVQVLQANPESRLGLTQADWLFFFGKA